MAGNPCSIITSGANATVLQLHTRLACTRGMFHCGRLCNQGAVCRMFAEGPFSCPQANTLAFICAWVQHTLITAVAHQRSGTACEVPSGLAQPSCSHFPGSS